MLKPVTLLSIVFALQSSVKSDSSDTVRAHELCFLKSCLSTFNLGIPYPICGTDNVPYHNWVQLNCSNLCAKKYGFEVRENFKGLCPGKAVADEYWRLKQILRREDCGKC